MFWLALAKRCLTNNVNKQKFDHLFDNLYFERHNVIPNDSISLTAKPVCTAAAADQAVFVPYGKCNRVPSSTTYPPTHTKKKKKDASYTAFVNWCELQPHFALWYTRSSFTKASAGYHFTPLSCWSLIPFLMLKINDLQQLADMQSCF